MCLCVCVSVCLSVCVSVCLSVCLSVSVCLFDRRDAEQDAIAATTRRRGTPFLLHRPHPSRVGITITLRSAGSGKGRRSDRAGVGFRRASRIGRVGGGPLYNYSFILKWAKNASIRCPASALPPPSRSTRAVPAVLSRVCVCVIDCGIVGVLQRVERLIPEKD